MFVLVKFSAYTKVKIFKINERESENHCTLLETAEAIIFPIALTFILALRIGA